MVETLDQEDYRKHVQFTEWVLNKMKHSPDYYEKKIILRDCTNQQSDHNANPLHYVHSVDYPDFVKLWLFSDEATSHLEGNVNRKNYFQWAKENPNWTVEKSLNSPA